MPSPFLSLPSPNKWPPLCPSLFAKRHPTPPPSLPLHGRSEAQSPPSLRVLSSSLPLRALSAEAPPSSSTISGRDLAPSLSLSPISIGALIIFLNPNPPIDPVTPSSDINRTAARLRERERGKMSRMSWSDAHLLPEETAKVEAEMRDYFEGSHDAKSPPPKSVSLVGHRADSRSPSPCSSNED